MHPIWLSDLLRAENDQVAGLLKQPDKQKTAKMFPLPLPPPAGQWRMRIRGVRNAIVKRGVVVR